MKDFDVEAFERSFKKRFIVKKVINGIVNLLIALGGFSTLLYSVYVNHKNLIDRLRFMTFNGTIFTSVVCLLFAVLCIIEAVRYKEITYSFIYYLRLSSATTELVILSVVLFGLLPFVKDDPDVTSYNGVMMHLLIPMATLLTFVFNDAPRGKLKPLQPFHGTWFITIYAVVFIFLFSTGILPSDLAPYSFLDFKGGSIWFSLACLIGIYATGYGLALLLSILNRRLSWIWFRKGNKH